MALVASASRTGGRDRCARTMLDASISSIRARPLSAPVSTHESISRMPRAGGGPISAPSVRISSSLMRSRILASVCSRSWAISCSSAAIRAVSTSTRSSSAWVVDAAESMDVRSWSRFAHCTRRSAASFVVSLLRSFVRTRVILVSVSALCLPSSASCPRRKAPLSEAVLSLASSSWSILILLSLPSARFVTAFVRSYSPQSAILAAASSISICTLAWTLGPTLGVSAVDPSSTLGIVPTWPRRGVSAVSLLSITAACCLRRPTASSTRGSEVGTRTRDRSSLISASLLVSPAFSLSRAPNLLASTGAWAAIALVNLDNRASSDRSGTSSDSSAWLTDSTCRTMSIALLNPAMSSSLLAISASLSTSPPALIP